jgi:hypothetical protein
MTPVISRLCSYLVDDVMIMTVGQLTDWKLAREDLKMRLISRAVLSSKPKLAIVFLAYRTADISRTRDEASDDNR